MAMDVRVSRLEDAPLIEAHGEIDHNNCGSVESALGSALDEGHLVVLLDLRDVTYIDSGGLSVLLSGVRRLRGGAQHQRQALAGDSGASRRSELPGVQRPRRGRGRSVLAGRP